MLGVLERDVSPEVLEGILTDLESYVVRRAVCNLTTKNYNRLFLSILNKLPSQDLTREQFRMVLLEQQGDSSIWPRDEDFQRAWIESPVFEGLGAARVQWILRRVEQRWRSNEPQNVESQSSFYVEHIMPQDWIATWSLPNGKQGIRWFERSNEAESKDEIEASNLRDRLKESFGNLTLIRQPLNAAISNASFERKKPEILSHSVLALDEQFHSLTVWNEDAIRERGLALFESARNIWPNGQ